MGRRRKSARGRQSGRGTTAESAAPASGRGGVELGGRRSRGRSLRDEWSEEETVMVAPAHNDFIEWT